MAEPTDAATGVFETPLGMVEYTVNQGDHVYLDAQTPRYGRGTAPLLVNRVEYNTSLHLHLIDGAWRAKDWHDLHMYRPNTITSEASSAARKKTMEVLTAAWSEFIEEHPELLRVGEIYELTRRLESLDEEIQKKAAEIETLAAERNRARARLNDIGYYGPNKQDWSARP